MEKQEDIFKALVSTLTNLYKRKRETEEERENKDINYC